MRSLSDMIAATAALVTMVTISPIRPAIPHLAESAKRHAARGSSGGHLILLSSIGAQMLVPGASDYQTSKHAINRLCEFIQTDHGADGVKCFAIHPGGVATDLGKAMPDAMHAYLSDSPELAACFVVWLCSGAVDWAAGRYLSANWDVEALVGMKSAILDHDLLVNRLRAEICERSSRSAAIRCRAVQRGFSAVTSE